MPPGDDALLGPLAALSARIRDRELSPVALAEACLARVERWQPLVNAFVTVTPERALADARAAEADLAAGHWRGPLHGIPCALEDLLDTRGIRTTCGARPYADRVPDRDATVAARLAAAGGVLVGKASAIELGGGLGYRSGAAALNGPCRNPWDPSRWAGGSSSGPAAAVAAGLVPYAIAADTWGSIAVPAAWCGATAIRPTYGAVSRAGAMPVAYTLGRVGAMARTAEDCALVLAAVAGPDPRDPSTAAPPRGIERVRADLPRGLRVAVLAPAPGVPAAAQEAFEAAQGVLRGAGTILEEAVLPDLPWAAVAQLVLRAEAANAFEDLIRSGRTRELADPSHATRRPEDYEPKASAADYVRAQRVRAEMQRALAAFFARHDAILAPAVSRPAPRVDEELEDAPPAHPVGAGGAVAGLPAVYFPVGFAGGMPVGAQLVGPPFEDARLLSAAAWFQARTRFHLELPPEPGAAPAAPPATPPPVARR